MCRKIAKLKIKILPSEREMPKNMPCRVCIQGTCISTSSHKTRGVLYRHICFSYFTKNGKAFPHIHLDCNNKHIKCRKKSELGRESAHWQGL